MNVADPLEQGFIENLARPGGNISGFTAFEPSIAGKSIETLKLISPTLANVAAVYNPQTSPYFPLFYRFLEIAAAQLNVKPIAIPVQDAASMQLAIDGLAQPNAGLAVVPSAFMAIHRDLIITLAARKRLPAIYGWNYFATSGGLVSYGFDPADLFRRASTRGGTSRSNHHRLHQPVCLDSIDRSFPERRAVADRHTRGWRHRTFSCWLRA